MKQILIVSLLIIISSINGVAQVNSKMSDKDHTSFTSPIIINNYSFELIKIVSTPIVFKYNLKYQSTLITSFDAEELPKPANYEYLTNRYCIPAITIRTGSKVIGKFKYLLL